MGNGVQEGSEREDIHVIGDVTEAFATGRGVEDGQRAWFRITNQWQLGLVMFWTITSLAILMLVFIGFYAWLTYPDTTEIKDLLGGRPAEDQDALNLVTQARDAWSTRVEHMAQMFLFGSLLPLLATIVGYTLGERRGDNSTAT